MADYVELLKEDLVEQFRDKKVIGVLLEAVGEQMNDLYNFFVALRDERWIDVAVGQQLEYVGDIVVLSRMEAGELACVTESVEVLDDETYRLYLYYKLWKNTNNCTYRDVLKALNMFWPYPLYYTEEIDQPATMIFDTGEIDSSIDIMQLINIPLIRAAGVKILFYITTRTEIDYTMDFHYGAVISPWSCHPLPLNSDSRLDAFVLDRDVLADDDTDETLSGTSSSELDAFRLNLSTLAEDE